MNQKAVNQDENNPPTAPNTRMSRLRQPTALKRPYSQDDNASKARKATPAVVQKPSNASVLRQTFTVAPKVASVPRSFNPSRTSTIAPKNPVVSNRTTVSVSKNEPKKRPNWDLRGKLADLEAAFKESQESAQKNASEIETLTAQNEVCMKENDELKQSVSDLSQKFNDVSSEYELCSKELHELKISYEQAEKDLQLRDQKLVEASTITAKQALEVEKLLSSNAELQNKYESVSEELISSTKKLSSLIEDHQNLTKQYNEKCSDLVDLNQQYESNKFQKESLSISLDTANQRINELNAELAQLRTSSTENMNVAVGLRKQIGDMNNANNDLESKLGLTGAELKALKEELNTYRYRLAQTDIERRMMHHRIMELRGTIRVCCRVRPCLMKEKESEKYSIEQLSNDSTVVIASSRFRETVTGDKAESNKYEFSFDTLFNEHSTQADVFLEIEPLIQSALDGYNVCIFAYGQTGSGKTYTMEGDSTDPCKVGLIQRSVEKVFSSLPLLKTNGWEYAIEASFVEIYNETLRDLLISDPSQSISTKLEIKMTTTSSKAPKEDSKRSGGASVATVDVPNLTTVQVTDADQVKSLLEIANRNRSVAATKCNKFSSRSHSIFRLKLVGINLVLGEACEAYVNLVDLAGSERLTQSGAEGDRLTETKFINKSLSTLKHVIMSLYRKESHVAFRDSKLTHLLQSSLAGNCKTLMFVNVSPLEENYGETLSSLRFAATVNRCHLGPATQQKTSIH